LNTWNYNLMQRGEVENIEEPLTIGDNLVVVFYIHAGVLGVGSIVFIIELGVVLWRLHGNLENS